MFFWILLLSCQYPFGNNVVSCTGPMKLEKTCSSLNDHENNNNPQPFLWVIGGNVPSYLFGTIHVPYVEVWDELQKVIMRAFNTTQNFYIETDLQNQKATQDLYRCTVLPNARRVSDILPSGTFDRLRSYLAFLKINIGSWLTAQQAKEGYTSEKIFNAFFKDWNEKRLIWTLNHMLDITKDKIVHFTRKSLDSHLYQLAKEQGKFIGDVENVKDICKVFNDVEFAPLLAWAHIILSLQNIAILDIASQQRERTLSDYLNGTISGSSLFQNSRYFDQYLKDARKIPSDSIIFDKEKSKRMVEQLTSYFREHLFVRRNKMMVEKILYLLNKRPNESFFFAFGAGHFIGRESVVDILRQHGLNVTRVCNPKSNTSDANLNVSATKNYKPESTISDVNINLPVTRAYKPKSQLSDDNFNLPVTRVYKSESKISDDNINLPTTRVNKPKLNLSDGGASIHTMQIPIQIIIAFNLFYEFVIAG